MNPLANRGFGTRGTRWVCTLLALLLAPLGGRVAASAPEGHRADASPQVAQVGCDRSDTNLGQTGGSGRAFDFGSPCLTSASLLELSTWSLGTSSRNVTTLASPASGRGTLTRTVRLAQGAHYDVTLMLAGVDGVSTPPSVMVQAGSIRRHLVGMPGSDWSRVGFQFQAPRTGIAELHISALSDAVRLDEVTISTVTEVGSLPLLVGGLVCMGLVLNRRRPTPIIPRLGRA